MSAAIARKVVQSFRSRPASGPSGPAALPLTDRERTVLEYLSQGFLYKEIAERLGLKNVDVKNARAETMNHEHDFVTGRAVADLRTFVHNTRQLLCKGAKHSLPNGILYWQGGDPAVEAELSFLNPVFSFELRPLLWNDEKFEGKRIVLYRSQDLLRCKKPDLPGMTQ